ncbi:hypothetical protein [Geoalkalibacter halelectricus]|uniref:hypothetical protein n=1 Tax=Geoalkalibacter halelectricus TaxID=2847045 RepID=UPI00266FB266|nr:hypothetical protein [Geoalkalibacter halelectricus]MDO3380312.1 hypothetical protein [Geoalkalibacter halelectricus]
MSIMVVSALEKFPIIIQKLGDPINHNIHWYNSQLPQGLAGPVLSLLPFVQLIVFDSPSYRSSRLKLLRREAKKHNVAIVCEDSMSAVPLPAGDVVISRDVQAETDLETGSSKLDRHGCGCAEVCPVCFCAEKSHGL